MATSKTFGNSYWTKRRKLQKIVNHHSTKVSESLQLKQKLKNNFYRNLPNIATHDDSRLLVPYDNSDIEYVSVKSEEFSEISNDLSDPYIADHISMSDKVRLWASTHNISTNAITALLQILQTDYPDLPTDAQTLMATPKNSRTEERPNNGLYHCSNCNSGLNNSHLERNLLVSLKCIKSEIRELKTMCRDILLQVQPFEEPATLPDGLELPLGSMEDLQYLERMLQCDTTNVRNNMIKLLSCVGGSHAKEIIRRVLKRLLSSNVAVQLNWKGRGTKLAFASLKVKSVVFDSVRRNPLASRSTDAEIQECIMTWLRLAKDRDGGRKQRAIRSATANTEFLTDETFM